MNNFTLQTMQPEEWPEVARLIHDSTNAWYRANKNQLMFPNGPESTLLFCEVYETLDPGCCLIAKSNSDQKITGSCFYHPRDTHLSLGIMNVHPEAFGKGVARALLHKIIEIADAEKKPVRLVSSAMNLDSFSLYNKAGFVPRQLYQDMIISIPDDGIKTDCSLPGKVRDANAGDIPAMSELEHQVAHIKRKKDYRFFVENPLNCFHTSVLYQLKNGRELLAGWIVSIAHPGSNMIGPCIAIDQEVAKALLLSELNYRANETMVFLVPVECGKLIAAAYGWGAKNCELHVAQVYGKFEPFQGVVMPSFMPETA